jgi:CheY-like chemotaxis protein
VREVLELEGYAVQTAEHGGPALEIMRASPERLVVLLGLVMPYVSGQEVLETVASDDALKRHAIVMVTGSNATIGRVAELREQLGVPLVAKPFTWEQIANAVEQAIGRLKKR